MTHEDPAKSLDELLEPGSTLMVGTSNGGQLEFRPLTVVRVDDGDIEILLDTNEEWVRALPPAAPVEVTMASDRKNTWLSLTGTATCSSDDALIDELWNPFAAAYFEDGRDTPGIAVMRINPTSGRYWSTPSGRIGSLVSMVRAKLGSPEQSGEHGDIDVDP